MSECSGCGGADARLRCSGCGTIYCGAQCQRTNWPEHREACRAAHQAFEALEQAHEKDQDDEEARLRLAEALAVGLGTPPDVKRAAALFLAGTASGESLWRAGLLLDDESVLRRGAEEHGHRECMIELGTRTNEAEWLRRAGDEARYGHRLVELGQRSEGEAVMRAAAEKEGGEAAFNWGVYLVEECEGAECKGQAAEQGSPAAAAQMGAWEAEQGRLDSAQTWFRRALKAGWTPQQGPA